MPKSTLALKSSVTRYEPPAVQPDLQERLQQLQHHQQQAAVTDPHPGGEGQQQFAEPETSSRPEPG